jgi:hypothetical protein
MRHVIVCWVMTSMLGPCASRVESVEPDENADDVLVGISYFAGWWEPLPNKWTVKGEDWRPKYPDRLPLLGEYNNQQTMDREIAAAADHGVDFFIILWYPLTADHEGGNAPLLNRAVAEFMASPHAHRMKFMIEYCNHPPFVAKTDQEWDSEWFDLLRAALVHPSYLRVDGKPVIKILSGHHLFHACDGDLDRVRQRLDSIRALARRVGAGEVLIGAGVGSQEPIPDGHWAATLFDFTATYMDVPLAEQREEDYPFADLAEFTHAGRMRHAHDAVPYMPYVPAGWNPRPWDDPRPRYRLPTEDEWANVLIRVNRDLREHTSLGLPGAKAFTIYAWNEYGEGGFVAPTRGEQYMKLKTIERVFNRKSREGRGR